ncbi:hypothetical protein NQ314_017461 [Rhamnusium bicolor]|uniref:Cytochrome b5-related protein n=1 Tax=Rhamnusium bicolor TaxID=1586634 RepID=A0AAV8WUI8_9CUCU|nr:hypothetical protein NQ314_017461 [Rhamnusium bicolor]
MECFLTCDKMNGVIHQITVSFATKCGLEQLLSSEKKENKELNVVSSLGIKYPTLRDNHLHSGEIWLDGKRADDGAEGLWRIYDNLYDFGDFVNLHPGGKDWLRLTKGTDITEAFEVHHLSISPNRLLPKHFVRKAKKPRNSPFTFEENGFYKTLKKKIHEKLKTVPEKPANREWRISHALSHHLYTNTVNDLEISAVEPFLQYLPTEKNLFVRYVSWLYSPMVYAFLYIGHFVRTLIQSAINGEGFTWDILLPFSVPALMFFITRESALFCAIMFLWIIITSSIQFGLVGLNAAHHHPDIFHDGDASRKDITGSHFLVLTNFGDHALHHLFPTIDHGLLEYLYPVFLEICEQFGIEWKLSSQLELVKGQFRQLAKVTPNVIPPKPITRID